MDEDFAEFARLMGRFGSLPADDELRLRVERVAESFARDGRRARKRARRVVDAELVSGSSLGAADRRPDAALLAPEEPKSLGRLSKARRCYVCKQPFREADGFYHRLCPECAADNLARRSARADLTGRRALLTGGRVKIGFQLALMLLRDGAEVIVTTRFPNDAVRRFQAAPGADAWLERLTVVGIDLRDPRQVVALCDRMCGEGRSLDILINNAAQTIRRPPQAYALLVAGERQAIDPGLVKVAPAPGFGPRPVSAPAWPTAQLEGTARPAKTLARASNALPEVDEAGLIPDVAESNSWSAQLGELDPAEVLETQLVNALAPALLCDRLLPLLRAADHERRYIVNVTAVEGRFAVVNKMPGHPHTNMAKAALNMLTRTSAEALADEGIYLCAVDTGWITDENPAPKKGRMAEAGFRTPLDIVDGAARVYDPIVRGEAGHPIFGVFLKDYREAQW